MKLDELIQQVFSRQPARAVVEASAGTGKTFTMEHLVVDRVCQGVPLTEILLVTFTEKAAMELRERVRGRLAKEAMKNPSPPLLRALADFDAATMTTIHGFAQRILTQFGALTHHPLEQELVEARSLIEPVIRERIRTDWFRDPAARAAVSCWLEHQTLDSMISTLTHCVESPYRLRFEQDLSQKLEDARLGLCKPGVFSVFETVFSRIKPSKNALVKYREFVNRLQEHLDSWQNLLLCLLFQDTRTLNGFVGQCEKVSVQLDPEDGEKLAVFLNLVEQVAVVRLTPVHGAALVLLPDLRLAVAQAKLSKMVWTYSDMIRQLDESLRDPAIAPALIREVKNRTRMALVDEFQDTDPAQWNILKTLFLEDPSSSLIVVGDPKQAIYRFRGADLNTYLQAKKEILAAGGTLVHLDTNFRSTPDMVAAINEFFSESANSPVFTDPDIRYDHPPGAGMPDLKLLPRSVPVVWLGMHFCVHAKQESLPWAMARQIAREILRVRGTRVTGEKPDGERMDVEVDFGDIFILVQKHHEGRVMGSVLGEFGIPVSFFKRATLFDGPEAAAILDTLRAVAKPQVTALQNRAFATPFFGIDMERIAAAGSMPRHHPAQQQLACWHELLRAQRLHDLLHHMFHESGIRGRLAKEGMVREELLYERIFAILRHGVLRLNWNADELVRCLNQLVEKGSGDQDLGGGDLSMEITDPGANAVRILTMHNAKGLEAPVVFLYGGFTGNPPTGIKEIPLGGERVIHIGKMDRQDPASGILRKEEDSEAQRLMYVAMTRARALLYVQLFTGEQTDDGKLSWDANAFKGAKKQLVNRVREWIGENGDANSLMTIRMEKEPCRECRDPPETVKMAPAVFPDGDENGMDEPRTSDVGNLLARRSGKPVYSYTSLKQRMPWNETSPREWLVDAWSAPDPGDLPPGTGTGICIHGLCETADLQWLRLAADFGEWFQGPGVESWIQSALVAARIHPDHILRAAQMVYRAFSTSMETSWGLLSPLSHSRQMVRELEFRIPWSGKHGLPTNVVTGEGFLMGFFDAVAELDGKLWIVDWKTDLLPDYEPVTIREHVITHYSLQAELYMHALATMLRGRAEIPLGGFLYVFVRGFSGSHGLFCIPAGAGGLS